MSPATRLRAVRTGCRVLAASFAALLLTACTQRTGCPADLHGTGEADARAGRSPSLPSPTCVLAGAERDHYLEGWSAGLSWYCQPRRHFELALAGNEAALGTCPLDRREAALAAQRSGTELRALRVQAEQAAADARTLADTDSAAAGAASLRERAARREAEQIEALAVVRGWLDNPALRDGLPPAPQAEPTP